MTAFQGVYKAVYDYEPQAADELALQEGELLYLIQKSDVDDWWTVKKRVLGHDVEEPMGVVPANYVEPASVISEVRALYDYEQAQNPEEELVFHENDIFEVFDDRDPDWLLVKPKALESYGFVPGNYVEPISQGVQAEPQSIEPGSTPSALPLPAPPITTATPASTFLPPPQRVDREEIAKQISSTAPPTNPGMPTPPEENFEDDDEGPPPAMPARPPNGNNTTTNESRRRLSFDRPRGTSDGARRHTDSHIDDYRSSQDDDYDDDYQTWEISEVEGRKKLKAKLSIGHNKIIFIPYKGSPQEWTIDKLTSYDNEKKHMFLEFVDPYKNLEIHTGNNDTCKVIMSVISEYKGASRGAGLREVEMASKTKKQGMVLYDFIAESSDELSVKQGDSVYILNDKKSRDWWMCELIGTGKRGVVPAQFIEPNKTKIGGGFMNSLKKMTKSNKSPKAAKRDSGDWRDDAHQDISSGSRRSRSRAGSTSARSKRSASAGAKKDLPNPKKSRLWIDRTGNFKVEAQFIGVADGKIHLHKANGVKIAVAADKLSSQDLDYVESVTGFSLEKFKVRGSDKNRSRRNSDNEERERRLREQELRELKRAREALERERDRIQSKELPPVKPPRPQNTGGPVSTGRSNYDWFEFFLNCGVDVSNCQRYTTSFEREKISEDMMQDMNPTMLRTLGLREGDIVRIMKFLDKKFGREQMLASPTGNTIKQPDSVSNSGMNAPNATTSIELTNQLSQPTVKSSPPSNNLDDDNWTTNPAATTGANMAGRRTEFTGSMQDLLDMEPLEPKKADPSIPSQGSEPKPNFKDLQPVKTGGSNSAAQPVTANPTGVTVLAPLDPFKTGGNNLLPMTTGFVMMPIATGGLMPLQRTGGPLMPMTTFGVQPTGGFGGSVIPQTSFATGALPLQRTGGGIPQTSFNMPAPGSVLPVQRTAGGLMPVNITGGAMSMNNIGFTQRTGGAMPSSSIGVHNTGGDLTKHLMGQNTMGGLPQTTFGSQVTGGAMPINTFGQQITGGALPQFNTGGVIPQTSFGQQITGGAMALQRTGGAIPQTTFGQQMTGGTMSQIRSGGMVPQGNLTQQMTNSIGQNLGQSQGVGFQPQSSFGLNLQRTGGLGQLQAPHLTGSIGYQNPMNQVMQGSQLTGGAMQMPATSFGNNVDALSLGLQNTVISQPQQALQSQPTGYGFGNGPQQPSKQANLYNASAANPFGF